MGSQECVPWRLTPDVQPWRSTLTLNPDPKGQRAKGAPPRLRASRSIDIKMSIPILLGPKPECSQCCLVSKCLFFHGVSPYQLSVCPSRALLNHIIAVSTQDKPTTATIVNANCSRPSPYQVILDHIMCPTLKPCVHFLRFSRPIMPFSSLVVPFFVSRWSQTNALFRVRISLTF